MYSSHICIYVYINMCNTDDPNCEAARTVGPIGSDDSGRKGLAAGWCSRP